MNKAMARDEENEFYRNMKLEDKLQIVNWFFKFKRKLEKKENPKITIVVDSG